MRWLCACSVGFLVFGVAPALDVLRETVFAYRPRLVGMVAVMIVVAAVAGEMNASVDSAVAVAVAVVLVWPWLWLRLSLMVVLLMPRLVLALPLLL